MMNRTFIAVVVLCGAAIQGWCTDNLIIKGRIVDSVALAPVSGIKVSANFVLRAPKTTTTDATGTFELGFPGSDVTVGGVIFFTTAELGLPQYKSLTINLPAGANQNDGVNDTIIAGNVKVAPTITVIDTLIIKGKLVDSANAAVPNATVLVVYQKIGRFVTDTFPPLKTGADGTFSIASVNIYSVRKVKFVIDGIPDLRNAPEFIDSLAPASGVSDGKTDIIDMLMEIKTGSGVIPFSRDCNDAKARGPFSVSVFSLNGRFLFRTTVQNVNSLSQSALGNIIHAPMPVIMVWRQNQRLMTRSMLLLGK
jgi:hypothetical protein